MATAALSRVRGWTRTLGEIVQFAFVSVIQIPALAISSTDIRRRVREGRPIHYLVPAEVASYIEERHLYEQAGD